MLLLYSLAIFEPSYSQTTGLSSSLELKLIAKAKIQVALKLPGRYFHHHTFTLVTEPRIQHDAEGGPIVMKRGIKL